MADEKEKMVWVRATEPVQKPDRTWAREGDVFLVPEGKLSKRCMVKLTAKEAEKAKAAAAEAGDDDGAADAGQEVADLTAELHEANEAKDQLQAELDQAKADLTAAQAEVAKLAGGGNTGGGSTNPQGQKPTGK